MRPYSSNHTYMPQLDSLRGIAVLAVMISHFGIGADWTWIVQSVDLGRIGVRLFFVLSGFLITGSLLQLKSEINHGNLSTKKALGLFYYNRALRIFPIYYAVIVTLWTIDFQNFSAVGLETALYLSNFDAVRYVGSPEQMVLAHASTAHFWSLAVEEQFYLIFPCFVFFLSRPQLKLFIFALIGIAIAWRFYFVFFSEIGFPYNGMLSLPSCLDSLSIGAALSLHRNRDNNTSFINRHHWQAILGMVLISTCCLSVFYAMDKGLRLFIVFYDSFIAILFALLIHRAAKSRQDTTGRFLQFQPFRYIGKISYGVYIYHPFVPHLITGFITLVGIQEEASNGVKIIAAYLVSFGIAAVSWKLFERPLLSLKRKSSPKAEQNIGTVLAQKAI